MENMDYKGNKKPEYKEKSFIEFINGIADKMQKFTDDKLDKLEEKLSK